MPLTVFVFGVAALPSLLGACNYRHGAPVKASDLPPPPGERVMHSGELLVDVLPSTEDSQCVAYEGQRTLCFHDIRPALEKAVGQGVWPAFPGVRVGPASAALPGEYVLELDVRLEVLPPDATGPGWSAGGQGRFRLYRDGELLTEEALASRSRAEFPYGSALGVAGSEVIDALGTYVAGAVSRAPENHPIPSRPLPKVSARTISGSTPLDPKPSTKPSIENEKTQSAESKHESTRLPENASAKAKAPEEL